MAVPAVVVMAVVAIPAVVTVPVMALPAVVMVVALPAPVPVLGFGILVGHQGAGHHSQCCQPAENDASKHDNLSSNPSPEVPGGHGVSGERGRPGRFPQDGQQGVCRAGR